MITSAATVTPAPRVLVYSSTRAETGATIVIRFARGGIASTAITTAPSTISASAPATAATTSATTTTASATATSTTISFAHDAPFR